MTFPYPLTPEVRADLWRFMGLPPEAAATMTVPPVLPVLALIPRNGDEDTVYKLTDTPFARAFVAWREVRAGLVAEAAYKASPPEERNCYTCAHAIGRNCALQVGDYPGEIDDYIGAACGPDGMPKDRTMQCPGFSSKVTP